MNYQDIQGAELADAQLIKKYNKGVIFLLCAVDIYSKYNWVVLMKGRKDNTITNTFQ